MPDREKREQSRRAIVEVTDYVKAEIAKAAAQQNLPKDGGGAEAVDEKGVRGDSEKS